MNAVVLMWNPEISSFKRVDFLNGMKNFDHFRLNWSVWEHEKRDDGSSDLYSLFDYKDFRDTMDMEKAYLQGRFDAIPYLSKPVI